MAAEVSCDEDISPVHEPLADVFVPAPVFAKAVNQDDHALRPAGRRPDTGIEVQVVTAAIMELVCLHIDLLKGPLSETTFSIPQADLSVPQQVKSTICSMALLL
jgi:hypothetical protein